MAGDSQRARFIVKGICVITGHDFVCIASVDWDTLWQGPQEVTARLAPAGNRVLYIENTGIRSPRLRDVGRIASRIRRWVTALWTSGVREVRPGVFVCSPIVLPPFEGMWARALNRWLLLALVKRVVRRMQMKDPIIWTYLPSDTALDLISMLRGARSVVVYYCVSDFSELASDRVQLLKTERSLVDSADLVFAHVPRLAKRFEEWGSRAHVFPFGVDLKTFSMAPHSLAPKPREWAALVGLTKPVIGYVGGLHRHVDYGLLKDAISERPDWSWVFVGPLQEDVSLLRAFRNAHFLGSQPHTYLPALLSTFDACIVPYALNSYTDTVLPSKINEYLALGKPVISTKLSPVVEFDDEYNVLFLSDQRGDSFVASIEEALETATDHTAVTRRRDIAALSDWSVKLDAMCELIGAELEKKLLQPQVS